MKTLSTLCLLLLVVRASATHLAGGYIQARPISGLQYEIRVTVYMNEATGAEGVRQATEIKLCTGDGSTLTLLRRMTLLLDQNTSQHEYVTTYTYTGPGIYQLTAWQENRTVAANLTKADEQLFSITTRLNTLVAKPNHTPVINLSPDSFSAFVNQPKKIVLTATDADNDSLSFVLTKPLAAIQANLCNALVATGYAYPNELTQKGTFKVDAPAKAIVWNAPTAAGRYTFDVKVLEWRDGVLIGETVLDMTISVLDRSGAADPIPPYEPVVEHNYNGQLVLSFDDTSTSGTLAAYPNPTTGRLHIILLSPGPFPAHIQVVNQNGQVIQELDLVKPQTRHEEILDSRPLPSGLYWLRAEINGRVLLRQIVKQ